jgi:hypothetical protein
MSFTRYIYLQLVPLHQSFGGMSGDGAQSYAATVISAAKVCIIYTSKKEYG